MVTCMISPWSPQWSLIWKATYLIILVLANVLSNKITLSMSLSGIELSTLLWWNGGARGQRVHHQHSATPLAEFRKEFVKKSGSGLTRVGRGWVDMILPSCEDSCNSVDPRNFGKNEWDQKRGQIECVIRCMIRWSEMRSIYPEVSQI